MLSARHHASNLSNLIVEFFFTNPGIDRATYRSAVRGNAEIEWCCANCIEIPDEVTIFVFHLLSLNGNTDFN